MPLLALNTVLPQTMRVKYQIAIGVLPLGLMFASFLPLIYFASWLEATLGMAPNSPVRNHENGAIWITAFLAVMVVLMLTGYAAGWVANAILVRFVFAWPNEKVAAVFLRSEVPAHWLKAGAGAETDASSQSIAKWEAQRKVGVFRFILNRGVLAWGAPMLLAMYVVPTIMKGHSFNPGAVIFNLALWAVAGAVFGAFIWYTSEANYRKLTSRK
jgi:hypothetical protein